MPLSLPDVGGYFCALLLPMVYPSPKTDKHKLITVIRLSIVNIGIPPFARFSPTTWGFLCNRRSQSSVEDEPPTVMVAPKNIIANICSKIKNKYNKSKRKSKQPNRVVQNCLDFIALEKECDNWNKS